MSQSQFAGASVLVAGAGVSGLSAAQALADLGAKVTVTDGNESRLASITEYATALSLTEPPPGTDLVVTSPGWRPETPLLAAATAAGIEVIGEVELAWRLDQESADGPRAWLVVTGTNGKTTTIGMLEHILRAAGADAVACGNVGLPVVDAVRAGHRVLAVELSSFQLHWSPSVRPSAGALLNIAEDHLDWHGSLAAYARAKAAVLTGEVAIGNLDDPLVAELLAASPAPRKIGVTLGEPQPGQFGITGGNLVDRVREAVLAEAAAIRPAGPPGLADALVAAALARAHGVSADAVRDGLASFQPIAHRASPVAEVDGVRYIDDSKATNPHAAASSLRAHDRVIWVAGGLLKGASVEDLVAEAAPRLAGVVLIGQDKDVIAAALARHAPEVPVHTVPEGDDKAMVSVVRAASAMARPGDVVLLAPAAASMDMFTDYTHRGRAFAQAVREVTQSSEAG
ncbi:UDP-N-acetylmuramoyl-L-alanine--D-glutamate ligase [Crossiella sp. CA198]|uniref:UDP-N-acetylmuramoyl-L-alanine--D-glutamate ligase n=1 Tax=Crossiella sp. CA198 TaxID=3455607 RepID=UPI003F8D2971